MNLYEAERLNRKTQSLRILSIFVGLAMILTHALVMYLYYSLPFDGLSGTAFHNLKKNESVEGFLIQKVVFTELADDIQRGDQVLAVNGHQVGTEDEWFGGTRVFTPENIRDRSTFTYSIKRYSQNFES